MSANESLVAERDRRQHLRGRLRGRRRRRGGPVVTKETHAFIGDCAHVTAGAADGLTVGTGAFTITQVDPRFDPSTPGLITGRHGLQSRSAPRRELPRGRAGHLRQRRQPEHRRPLERRGRPERRSTTSTSSGRRAIQLKTAPGGSTSGSGALACSGVDGLRAHRAVGGEPRRVAPLRPDRPGRRPRGHLAALQPAERHRREHGHRHDHAAVHHRHRDRRPGAVQLRRRTGRSAASWTARPTTRRTS